MRKDPEGRTDEMKNIRNLLKKMSRVWMVICTVFFTIEILAVLFIFAFDRDFLKIDTCLDRGGRWNYKTRVCEGPD